MSVPTYNLIARVVGLLIGAINLYILIIVVAVVVSWLVVFGVLNTYNRWVRQFVQLLDSVTEPVFRRVRRMIPPVSGFDLSPIIVFFLLQLVVVLLDYARDTAALHVVGP